VLKLRIDISAHEFVYSCTCVERDAYTGGYRNMAGTHLVIPDKIKEEAKVKALREKLTLSDVVARYLAAWASGRVPLPPSEVLDVFESEGGA
jgi:hypothetical protein